VGAFDFMVFFGSFTTGFDQLEIRRDIAITADLSFGTIDLAQEHTQALVPTMFTAPGVDPAESRSAYLFLQSGNTFALEPAFNQPSEAWQISLAPDLALRTTDTQRVLLQTSSSDSSAQVRQRGVSHVVHDGIPTTVALMDPLGTTGFETTADRFTATWAPLPVYDELDIWRESFSSDFSHTVDHELLVSRAFIASTGAASVTLDFTDVPGFPPAWRLDPTLEQSLGFEADLALSADEERFAQVTEDIAAPPLVAAGAAPRHVEATRVRALVQQRRAELQHQRWAQRRPR
jgi:hypothetical protein